MLPFTPTQSRLLLALALFGLIVPNGVFIYYTMFEWNTLIAAMTNPVALVFIVEAFTIMFLIASLISRRSLRSPGWLAFILLSLAGSMMFSVPFCLWMWNRQRGGTS